MTRRLATATALVLALVASSCAADTATEAADPTDSPESAPATSATPTPAPSPTVSEPAPPTEEPDPGTTLVVAPSDFGPMLFNEDEQAIYIWEVETSETPECYDDCAVAWPPVLTDGEPVAGDGVDAALLGTTERRGGATQVTYNGHPLYYYAHEQPGEVKCHNIATHGGLWWVVTPEGDRAP